MSRQQRWQAANRRISYLNALVEVASAILMLLELITPSRAIIPTVMLWQMLQFRYVARCLSRACACAHVQAPAPAPCVRALPRAHARSCHPLTPHSRTSPGAARGVVGG
jgi:hypothetical protein